MTFRKDDAEKPKIHLLPHEALIGVAEVMGHGAQKYARYNWRETTTWNRYYDAAMRHMLDWQMGKDVDESGLATIDHAAASLLMLSSLIKTETGEDDRYNPGASESVAPRAARRPERKGRDAANALADSEVPRRKGGGRRRASGRK